MQPYRSDLEALEARHAALEAEVADRVRQRDEAARMIAEARAQQRADEIAADRMAGGPARRRSFVVTIALGAFVFAALVAAFSRINSRDNDREVKMARIMAQFEKFTNDACACKDSACVNELSDRMAKWGNEVAKDIPSNDKPDAKTLERATALGQRMADCMTKIMTADVPQTMYESQAGGINGHGNSNNTVEGAERAD